MTCKLFDQTSGGSIGWAYRRDRNNQIHKDSVLA
jgi:hypothetical protein